MFKILNKNINKFILLIPTLLLASPVFADGFLLLGGTYIIVSKEAIPIIDMVVFIVIDLFITILLEAIVMKIFCFKEDSFKKPFKIMLKANIYSTIVAIITLFALSLISKNVINAITNVWGGSSTPQDFNLILILGFLLFVEFCVVEYFSVKKDLKNSLITGIKIPIIIANIVSYIITPFMAIFIMYIGYIFMALK